MTDVDATACPSCETKGVYDGRVLLDGRGIYTCPSSSCGTRWQNTDEKPSNKGAYVPNVAPR